jgi:hypothetical protein
LAKTRLANPTLRRLFHNRNFSVTFPTLLQQNIPQEILSRVGSYFWLARVAATPLAFALVGPLSARFGIATVFDSAALLLGGATLLGCCFPEIWSISGNVRAHDDTD